MENLKKLKELKELYVKRACGANFVEAKILESKPIVQNKTTNKGANLDDSIRHCKLCQIHTRKPPTLGYIKPESSIIFINDMPLGDMLKNGANLFDNKASVMIKNIAEKIFCVKTFSLLSVIKCEADTFTPHEANICKNYLIEQLNLLNAKIVVAFGENVLSSIYGLDSSHMGVVLDLYNKKSIATFSVEKLLRNETLKKEAMKHFNLIKKFL